MTGWTNRERRQEDGRLHFCNAGGLYRVVWRTLSSKTSQSYGSYTFPVPDHSRYLLDSRIWSAALRHTRASTGDKRCLLAVKSHGLTRCIMPQCCHRFSGSQIRRKEWQLPDILRTETRLMSTPAALRISVSRRSPVRRQSQLGSSRGMMIRVASRSFGHQAASYDKGRSQHHDQ